MKDRLLPLYHRAPYPLKVLAASAWGYYLRWWRYGPETERLVAEAREREYWSPEKWKVWQENRLGYVLHRAATQVPYYREQWAQRRRRGDRASWEYLENWPILEKDPLRQHPKAFVADDCNIQNMFHEHTSGSTGKPLDLWWSKKTVQAWYALFEARCRNWYGVSRRDRWGILGGQLVAPAKNRTPPFWVWNAALNQLYLSSYHLAPDLMYYYLKAIQKYRIRYLWGYSSALHALATWLIQNRSFNLDLRVVITNAEPLYAYQLDAMKVAFRCPIRETYGMSEIVASASECEAGNLHLWPEVGVTEIQTRDWGTDNGGSGEIICTGLLNQDMPLIRYQVGDQGSPSLSSHQCPCGRSLPLLGKIDGRCDDIIYSKDGRMIGRLDPVFKTQLPILEAQIVQESLDLIQVNFVPAPEFSVVDGKSLIQRLQDRLGPINVSLNPVHEIPRGPNAKFRAVICNLTQEKKANLVKQKR
ncbi:MAG: hypothetical protein PHW74_06575 [Desulfobacca sp.]|nr:hypothetical protein [Desulfobacca sp.]